MEMSDKMLTKMVEEYVKNNDCTYIDALTDICQDMSVEPEDITAYVCPILKEKLRSDAVRHRLMRTSEPTLPI